MPGLRTTDTLASELTRPAPPTPAPGAGREALREAATRFEALFYNQLLSSMRATVPENEFWGASSGTRIYRQLHDQELSGRLADQGGLGIADLIVRQFESAVDREGSPADAVPPELPALHRRGLSTYQQEAVTRPSPDELVRLRHLAGEVGGAAADTLDRFQDDLVAAAREHELDPALLLAVTVRESAGDPRAVSPRGAQGLMQLMPGTAREVGVADPFDPADNLRGGARYLARMLDRYDGDVDLALAAYNAGPGTVDRAGRAVPAYPETIQYVERVTSLARRLGARSGTDLVTSARETELPRTR
ncbi:transglycosylase SLT domain-containing protein [bacterium]|nr:transglycosylase SLT domain-containing protein [bacterium]